MYLWIIAAVVAGLDQAAKFLVLAYLPQGSALAACPPYLYLAHVQNPGGAFGILAGRGAIIVLLSLLVVVLAAFFTPRITAAGHTLEAGLILGGTLGNLVDRLRVGQVIDFIDLNFWPAFNLADVAITAGVLLTLWRLARTEGRRRGTGCS